MTLDTLFLSDHCFQSFFFHFWRSVFFNHFTEIASKSWKTNWGIQAASVLFHNPTLATSTMEISKAQYEVHQSHRSTHFSILVTNIVLIETCTLISHKCAHIYMLTGSSAHTCTEITSLIVGNGVPISVPPNSEWKQSCTQREKGSPYLRNCNVRSDWTLAAVKQIWNPVDSSSVWQKELSLVRR